jgi:hypothetical protein
MVLVEMLCGQAPMQRQFLTADGVQRKTYRILACLKSPQEKGPL